MDVPDLPDAAVAALIAGAIAFVTQALVKVWEVRQKRRDTVAPIYAARLAAVFRAVRAARRLQSQRERTRYLRLLANHPFEALISSPWHDPDEKARNREKAQERKENLKAAEERLAQRQAELGQAYEDLDQNRALFLLYARPPLHQVNDRLQEAFERALDDEETEESISDISAAWARTAQRELVAMGSIGFSVLVYAGRSFWASRVIAGRRTESDAIEHSQQVESAGEASQSGADDHGADNDSSSESGSGEDAGKDNDEFGRPPGS